MNKKTIIILGAYGQAGRSFVYSILKSNIYKVIAVGRNKEKLSDLKAKMNNSALVTKCLTITDLDEIHTLCKSAFALINCIGPYLYYGTDIVKSVISAGAHYFDVAAEQEHYRRLIQLEQLAIENNVVIGTGLGFFPGVSGLLLDYLAIKHGQLSDCQMSLFQPMHLKTEDGIASLKGAILEIAYQNEVLVNGRLIERFPGEQIYVDFADNNSGKATIIWPNSEILHFSKDKRIRDLKTSIFVIDSQSLSDRLIKFIKWMAPQKRKIIFNLLSRYLLKKKKIEGRTISKLKDSSIYISINYSANGKEYIVNLKSKLETCNSTLILDIIEALEETPNRGFVSATDIINSNDFFGKYHNEYKLWV